MKNKPLLSKLLTLSSFLVATIMLLIPVPKAEAQWNPSPSPSPNTNIYYNAGNVGIGTASPSAVLHVKGDGTGILVERNAADGGGAVINFKNSLGDLGFVGRMNNAGASANNILGLSADGSNYHLAILPSGNVGIGTTAPKRKLELVGDVGGLSFEAGSGTPNSGAIRFGDNSGWKFHVGRSRDSVGGSLNSGTSGVLMTIQDNGNIGIGTTGPVYRLDVQGGFTSSASGFISKNNPWGTSDSAFFPNGITTAGATNWIYGGNTYIGNAPSNGFGHQFSAANGASNAYLAIGGGSVGIGTITPNYKLDLQGGQINASGGFCINGDCKTAWSQVGGGGSSQWTTSGSNLYYNSGNVGIGITSPSFKLQVGSSNGQSLMGDSGTQVFHQIRPNAGKQGWLAFTEDGVADRWAVGIKNADAKLYFSTGNLGSLSDKLVIDGSGNVGIGTNTPGSKLVLVSGSGNAYFLNDTTGLGSLWGFGGVNGGSLAIGAYTPSAGNLITRLGINYAVHSGNGSTQFAVMGAKQSPLIELNAQDGSVSLFGENGSGADYRTPSLNLGVSVRGDGKVGIGTTAPSSKLDVAGEIRSSTGGFRFPDGTLQTTSASGGGGGTITGVTAGAGLTGGGTAGAVTVNNDDRGSSQNIFKNIANTSGTIQFSAGSNIDVIRFAGSGGTTVSFDASLKKVTIDGPSSTPAAANISAGQFGQNTGGGNYTFPGNVTVNGNLAAKYQDVAEWVPSSEQVSPGTVVVLDPTKSNQVTSSSQSYDTRVAGVVSERPGIALGESGNGKVLVATTGRVMVQVDATRAPIHIGDLLVTSDVSGVAMKSVPVDLGSVKIHRPGTIIGKALEPLEKGSGKILVLLSLQ